MQISLADFSFKVMIFVHKSAYANEYDAHKLKQLIYIKCFPQI